MACIDAEGHITRSAELILLAFKDENTLEAAAKESRLPLFRIRSAVRELSKAKLIEKAGGKFKTTHKGIEAIEGKGV